MNVKLLTEHHVEFLSVKGDCTGSSESKLVKIPHCWKSHVAAHIFSHFYITTKAVMVVYTRFTVIANQVIVMGIANAADKL